MNNTLTQPNIRVYQPADEAAVIDLWQRCKLVVPWNDPHQDIAFKLAFQPDLFFVGTVDNHVIASMMVGYEGHRGWLNYLAVHPDYQRQGVGRQMVEHAIKTLKAIGCPKLNLQVRETNQAVIAFYQRLGFTSDHVIGLGRHLRDDAGHA